MKNLTRDVELWPDINQDPAARTQQYSFDLAAAWPVHRNVQRDAGHRFSASTAPHQIFVGLSQRS